MKRTFVLFGLLALVSIAAFTVYAVENATWGEIKAALKDEAAPPLAKKGGGNGKGGDKTAYSVDAIRGDFVPLNEEESVLVSTCSGSTNGKTLNVTWPRHDGCMDITPLGSSCMLTDDPSLSVGTRKGEIVSVTFWIQDVIGAEGIMHSTEKISVEPPVAPSPDGFILHVHADGVPVWRHKGHLGGPRVQVIGTISVGDIVFTPAP